MMAIFDLDGSVEAERKPLAERIGWLEQGIKLADKDLERVAKRLHPDAAAELERIREQLRKTIEGPEAGS